MSILPPSFLGKKVYIDSTKQRYYVVRYEEPSGLKKVNVLLFDQDAPIIFAVLHHDGRFLDSFYLTNKTTQESAKAMERYKKIAERKKQHKVTQDDLRDALKSEEDAKMKNENILKHLVDEHLEDIKHLWPSRLLTLQKTDGKSDNSLILIALEEALDQANATKSFQFLVQHRYDSLIPALGKHYENHPNLLDDVTNYYLSHNHRDIVEQFLDEATKNVSIHEHDLIEQLLNTAKRVDHIYYSNTMRHLLSKLFKRVKHETNESPKEWLKETIHDKKLKQSIVDTLKKKIG
ncbi:hypothetical protein QA612_01910 [Evansella sp. AB-P1]|uniref:hypothetical protein n=1 Tax=Evansella sp. AB-P1 TaxID=3037653 RepID=UPI0024200F49|nr:hypothetical protein [Evansella sp. AB-P1]MDG5786228.1 hypothetical protein [Evansella sp. AB-P1]